MLAIRNLWRHKLRTVVTGSGVATGVTLFMALFAISQGLKSEVETLIYSQRIDLVVQSKSAGSPFASRIHMEDCDRLPDIPDVRQVIPMLIGAIQAWWSPYQMVIGVSSVMPLVDSFGMMEGRPFSPGSQEVMLGKIMAQTGGYYPGGKIMLESNRFFTITGIYATGTRLMDGAMLMDLRNARALLLSQDNTVNLALIQLAPRAEAQTVIRAIDERFPHLSAIRSGMFANKLSVIRVVHAAAWSISIIGVLAGCLVVMNTMLMAVTERTREIGVLLAIGWSRWRIVRMILAESLVLCAGAGVAGIAFAWVLLGGMLRLDLGGAGFWLTGCITWPLCAEAFGLSLMLGMLGAIYPAWIASRLMPARCLRYEFI